MVASYVGNFSIVVKLHCHPFFFSRLSAKMLAKYAYTFRITVEELTDIDRIRKHDR